MKVYNTSKIVKNTCDETDLSEFKRLQIESSLKKSFYTTILQNVLSAF